MLLSPATSVYLFPNVVSLSSHSFTSSSLSLSHTLPLSFSFSICFFLSLPPSFSPPPVFRFLTGNPYCQSSNHVVRTCQLVDRFQDLIWTLLGLFPSSSHTSGLLPYWFPRHRLFQGVYYCGLTDIQKNRKKKRKKELDLVQVVRQLSDLKKK